MSSKSRAVSTIARDVPEVGPEEFCETYWRSAVQLGRRLSDIPAQALGDDDFRLMAEHLPTLCWIANGEGYIVWYNRRWHEYCGTTPAQMEGWGWQAVHNPAALPDVMARWIASIATGDAFEMVFPLRGADGRFRPFLTRISPIRDAEGRLVRWFGSNVEIGAQVAAEAALSRSEARFEAITNSVDQMIWSTLPDGYHDYYNQRWYDFTGMPEGSTDGEAWNGMFHQDDQERAWGLWRHCLATGEPYHIEYRLRHRSGAYRWVVGRALCVRDETGAITRWFGTCTDIQAIVEAREVLARSHDELEGLVAERTAELERAQEALRQSQKMEAVGQLTGGVAHDFNNLLTIVTGNIDMALRSLAAAGVTDARSHRALDNAMKGAERAAALTQRLLAFSRRQPLAPKPLDVDRLVQGMSDMLERTLGETVELEIVTSPGLWRVEVDPNQLEAAILNLAVNARDSMPSGGTLAIETANARLGEDAAQHAEVAPGAYVAVAVTDTGHGMSKETLTRVFEPFFTTKEVGKGTGLGLSMVYGFVKQSGGHVKIYSEEGHGTSVKLYLPRLMTDATDDGGEPHLTRGLEVSRRLETVLVVEDDDDVRAYTVECLRELGYRVLEAHDGASAIRLMERQDRPIDLLFTDVVMPKMSGSDLAAELRQRQPGLKVLFTSGYTRNAIVHGGRLDPGVEMIAKPFAFTALAQKVRDVLDQGRTGRVLVVEPESTVRTLAVEALTAAGYVAEEAATAQEALGKIRSAQGRYDIILLDSALPDRPGDQLVGEIHALHADLPIVLTVPSDRRTARKISDSDRLCTVRKPYSGVTLADAIKRLGVVARDRAMGSQV